MFETQGKKRMDTSIFSKASTIIEHAKKLFLLEMTWLKKEIKDTAKGVAVGLIVSITGIFIIVSGINSVLGALVVALVEAGLSPILASFLMAIILILLGVITLLYGINKINANLDASQTTEHFERDAQAVREGLHEKA